MARLYLELNKISEKVYDIEIFREEQKGHSTFQHFLTTIKAIDKDQAMAIFYASKRKGAKPILKLIDCQLERPLVST